MSSAYARYEGYANSGRLQSSGVLRKESPRERNDRSIKAEAGSPATDNVPQPPIEKQGKGGLIGRNEVRIVFVSALVIALGTINRFLFKAQLNGPMSEHIFFLAQLTTLGYVAIYFSILAYRFRVGIVTKTMLDIPKTKFAVIGALEAASLVLGMIAAANVPGPLIPILAQTFLIWQVGLSVLILQRSFSRMQYIGAGLVAIGAAVSTANSGSLMSLEQSMTALIGPSLLFLLSVAPPALASVIKESIFSDGKKLIPPDPQTGKGGLDIFVVNSFGSLFQSLFVFLLLPVTSSMQGISLSNLPTYVSEGFFLLQSNLSLPLLYVIVNISFNICILYLLSISSAVLVSGLHLILDSLYILLFFFFLFQKTSKFLVLMKFEEDTYGFSEYISATFTKSFQVGMAFSALLTLDVAARANSINPSLSVLSASICVPLTIVIFTLPFPQQISEFLNSVNLFPSLSDTFSKIHPAVLSSTFLQGVFLLMVGLVAWNADKLKSPMHRKKE